VSAGPEPGAATVYDRPMRATAAALVLFTAIATTGCSKHDSRSATDVGANGSAGATVPPVVVDAAPADPAMRAVPRPVPAGPYLVAYDCSHSNMPFGKGGWSRSTSLDLAKRAWTTLEVTSTGDEDDLPVATPPPPPRPTVSAASPAVADKIAAAVDKMLAGGPYRSEWPVSEGTPCTLAITTPAGAEVYRIDKAYNVEKDAVNDLIALFNASVGR